MAGDRKSVVIDPSATSQNRITARGFVNSAGRPYVAPVRTEDLAVWNHHAVPRLVLGMSA